MLPEYKIMECIQKGKIMQWVVTGRFKTYQEMKDHAQPLIESGKYRYWMEDTDNGIISLSN